MEMLQAETRPGAAPDPHLIPRVSRPRHRCLHEHHRPECLFPELAPPKFPLSQSAHQIDG